MQIGAEVFSEQMSYDSSGRVLASMDASGDSVTQQYTGRGYPWRLVHSRPEVGSSGVYYEVFAHDPYEHVSQDIRAGTIGTTRTYLPHRSWIDQACAGTNCGIQFWDFDYDPEGNLTRRQRGADLVEEFAYDKLDRLTSVTLHSGGVATSTDVTYDALGNVCSKGAATYDYFGRSGCYGSLGDVARPHAVHRVGPYYYQYDASGNQTSQDGPAGDDRSATYDALNALRTLSRASPSAQTTFYYTPDGARFQRVDVVGGVTTTTVQVGRVERITNATSVTTKRHLDGGAIVVTTSGSGVVDDLYVFTDHLGSTDVVTNDQGVVVNPMSFDAWGRRRNTGNWTHPPQVQTHVTKRGFTGHEQVDAFELVHMNGRVYDPVIARFIQADPVLDVGVQGLNRYSYVLNNPVTHTDPTGHLTWGEWMRVGINVALGFVTQGGTWNGAALQGVDKAVAAAAGGALAGATQSQTLKGAGWGAVSALAFHRVGSYFESAAWASEGANVFGTRLNASGYAAKVLAHGALGGAVQHLQGGRFGDGFASAGLTQAFSGVVDRIDPANPVGTSMSAQRIVVAALIGGTVSSVSGGKFAHGALTGAFSYAFGEMASGGCRSCDASGSPAGADWSMRNANPDWQDKLSTVVENGVTVIRGELTVSGSGSAYAASDVNAHWYGATGSYQGVSYRSEIKLVPVAKGGDWQMRTMSRKDWTSLSRRAGGTVGGQNWIGESIMRMTPDNSYWRQAAVPAHEFGHALGLSHAPRGSGSMMSYDPGRAVGGRDLYNVASGYR